jgi:hypothetical protein
MQCSFQVLDQDLDLRTVKYSIWKSSGDIRLYYREIDPLPKAAAGDNGDSTKTADSAEQGKDEKPEGGETKEQDNTSSEEAPQADLEGEGGEEEEMETEEGEKEEQLVAVMDGEEEKGSEEKMEDSRTEDKS